MEVLNGRMDSATSEYMPIRALGSLRSATSMAYYPSPRPVNSRPADTLGGAVLFWVHPGASRTNHRQSFWCSGSLRPALAGNCPGTPARTLGSGKGYSLPEAVYKPPRHDLRMVPRKREGVFADLDLSASDSKTAGQPPPRTQGADTRLYVIWHRAYCALESKRQIWEEKNWI